MSSGQEDVCQGGSARMLREATPGQSSESEVVMTPESSSSTAAAGSQGEETPEGGHLDDETEKSLWQLMYKESHRDLGVDQPTLPAAQRKKFSGWIADNTVLTFRNSLNASKNKEDSEGGEGSHTNPTPPATLQDLYPPPPQQEPSSPKWWADDLSSKEKACMESAIKTEEAVKAYCEKRAELEGISVEEARKLSISDAAQLCESGRVLIWDGGKITCEAHKFANCAKCLINVTGTTIDDVAKQLSKEHIATLLNALEEDGRPTLSIFTERDPPYMDPIHLKKNPKREPFWVFDYRTGLMTDWNNLYNTTAWLGKHALFVPQKDHQARGKETVLQEEGTNTAPTKPMHPDAFKWLECGGENNDGACNGLTWLVGPSENRPSTVHPSHHTLWDDMGTHRSILVQIDGAFCPKGKAVPGSDMTAPLTEQRASYGVHFAPGSMYNSAGMVTRLTLNPRAPGVRIDYKEDPAHLPFAARASPITAHTAVFGAAIEALRTMGDWALHEHREAVDKQAKKATTLARKRAQVVRVIIATTSLELVDAICTHVEGDWDRRIREVTPRMWEDLEKGAVAAIAGKKKNKKRSNKKKGKQAAEDDGDEDSEGPAEEQEAKPADMATQGKNEKPEKPKIEESKETRDKQPEPATDAVMPTEASTADAPLSKTGLKKARKAAKAATAVAQSHAGKDGTDSKGNDEGKDKVSGTDNKEMDDTGKSKEKAEPDTPVVTTPVAAPDPLMKKPKPDTTAKASAAVPDFTIKASGEIDWPRLLSQLHKFHRKAIPEELLFRAQAQTGWAQRCLDRDIVYVAKPAGPAKPEDAWKMGSDVTTVGTPTTLPPVPHSAAVHALVREIGVLAGEGVLVSFWLVPGRFVAEATKLARGALATGEGFVPDVVRRAAEEEAKREAAKKGARRPTCRTGSSMCCR